MFFFQNFRNSCGKITNAEGMKTCGKRQWGNIQVGRSFKSLPTRDSYLRRNVCWSIGWMPLKPRMPPHCDFRVYGSGWCASRLSPAWSDSLYLRSFVPICICMLVHIVAWQSHRNVVTTRPDCLYAWHGSSCLKFHSVFYDLFEIFLRRRAVTSVNSYQINIRYDCIRSHLPNRSTTSDVNWESVKTAVSCRMTTWLKVAPFISHFSVETIMLCCWSSALQCTFILS